MLGHHKKRSFACHFGPGDDKSAVGQPHVAAAQIPRNQPGAPRAVFVEHLRLPHVMRRARQKSCWLRLLVL